jgi:hypothetical protein
MMDKVKSRLLLDVVIQRRAPVLELIAGEDQAMLVRKNTESLGQLSSRRSRNT